MRQLAVVLLGAVAVSACGSSTRASTTTAAGDPPPAPTVHAGEQNNHHTLTVRRTQTIVVTLHSTYWRFSPVTPGVLSAVGQPVYAPRRQGCVAGEGCGTVTATYRATDAGTTTIRATRTSCGEALRCLGGAGTYAVKIVVKS